MGNDDVTTPQASSSPTTSSPASAPSPTPASASASSASSPTASTATTTGPVGSARDRREVLLALIREQGTLAVSDLSTQFGVSQETARRDVRALEDRGLVTRSYGEVTAVDVSTFETDRAFRETHQTEEKLRIAAAASRYVDTAETIFLDEGYLPLLVGRALSVERDLTIITTSLPTAMEMSERPRTRVISVGGRVRRTTMGVVDFWALGTLRQMTPDLAFIGANGVSEDGWLSTPDPAVASVKETVIAAARRSVFVGGHEKFGRQTFTRFAHVREMEVLLTGHELRSTTAQRLSLLGTKVERV
ncbi:DeoR/GlpR transcriptional regulator [Actinomyces lilanjuaniae]|uniref:Lactose phosphotransferase system repressor n=1 Tax=Actinomyces lilanjuaniae TaxID=2321394 RepID=A0ABM6Z1Z9_9ACTO|nr:DeoR/GlpR family DNA-binding transcription regulator [Actinomyces lilanjuaniae]AYD89244.1 DeoR/GlpR transcriptional regulator [Actinomyces lilanjuaniae]